MATTATIIYPELIGEPYFVGIQFEEPTGTQRRAVCNAMNYVSGNIAVGWQLQTLVTELDGTAYWQTSTASTPPLTVTNNTYRSLATMQVVPASEALDPDGRLKAGYLTEYEFFRMFFGLDNNQPKGIFWFMCDALVRRLNALYPTLNLTL